MYATGEFPTISGRTLCLNLWDPSSERPLIWTSREHRQQSQEPTERRWPPCRRSTRPHAVWRAKGLLADTLDALFGALQPGDPSFPIVIP